MAEQVGGIYFDVDLETRGLLNAERRVGRSLARVGDEGDRLQARFTKISAAIAAALSAIAVEGLVSKLVTAQRQFDVMFASLKTMTGGVDQASAAFERLRQFASQTPFSLEQAVKGFVKLKALGLDPSERAMGSFGNTASAMGKSLEQMIEAVADASTGEFERLKEFGIKAKVEGDNVSLTFQGVTTKIRNSSAEITEYLTRIGEVNFAGAMAERMKTLDGDISNLQDTLAGLYLTISQSGFGDVVAQGVRAATEAISEMTVSIKEGGLTEYFDGLRPILAAAELAVVTLAGVVAGNLVRAMMAAMAQAYATATALGAATVAARGFTAVLAALGGPIGIAITGLTLLALNWDKIAGSAADAATISERAAERIAAALKRSPARATNDLNALLSETQAQLKKVDGELAAGNVRSIYGDRGTVYSAEKLAELQEQRDALLKVVGEIRTAMNGLGGGGGRGSIIPALVNPKEPTPGPTTKPKRTTDAVGDAEDSFQRRIDDWWYADQEARDRQEQADEDAAARRREQLMDEAEQRRLDIEESGRREAEARQRAAELEYQITKAVNPVDALRQEYEAKLAIVEQYEQMMALAGVNAVEQGQIARTEITRSYEAQRLALAEQSFRSQSDSNAFLIDSINALATSASGAIVGLINGTMTASDAMRGLANVVLNEAVNSLVQIGVQQIKNSLLGKTLATADQARKTAQGAIYAASVGAQVAGMTALAAQNAFAATAAIPVVGPGLAPAAAAAAGAAAAAIGAPAVATAPLAGARQYGGPVDAGRLYRVNEGGAPEMFMGSAGQQYMLPTKSGRVIPADQAGRGQGGWTIVINNAPAGTTASVDEQSRTVEIAVAAVASQISSNSGPVWSAMRSATTVGPRQ